MPEEVQDNFGYALFLAQIGSTPASARPLRGFRGAGVLELIEDFSTDTYRAVYTVRFAGVVYVLHVFQKKSTQGIKTQAHDQDLIQQRLRDSEHHYRNVFQRRMG